MSILFSFLALIARQRIQCLVSGVGSTSAAGFNCRFCTLSSIWATTFAASQDCDRMAFRTLSGRTSNRSLVCKKEKKTERIKNRGTQEMPTRIQTFLKHHTKQLCILLSMDNFNVHFSKTDPSVKMHCPLVDWDWRRVAYFKTEGEENCPDGKEDEVWRFLHSRKNFMGASYLTDSVFMVTGVLYELQGENAGGHCKLVVISNNYTEVSDENGILFFFCYDL